MKNKNLVIGVVAVLAVLLIGYGLWFATRNQAPTPRATTPPAATTPPPAARGTTSGAISASVRAYEAALHIYADNGYRFQFANCSGTPGSLTMKNGVKFMLDNRDNQAHTFVVGGATYHIDAWSYAVATAGRIGTYNITCDGGGAAQVIVEK